MDRNWSMTPCPPWKPSSPPARVAWIETPGVCAVLSVAAVATREGGVDRNSKLHVGVLTTTVATREGGVDRNKNSDCAAGAVAAASPPARVAWIETA